MNYAYILEKQLDHLVLNKKVKDVCKSLIKKTKKEIEKNNPDMLSSFMSELEEMKKDFEIIADNSSNKGKNQKKKESDTKELRKVTRDKKDDTRPLNDIVKLPLTYLLDGQTCSL